MDEKEGEGNPANERLKRLSPPAIALVAVALAGLVGGLGVIGWRLTNAPAPRAEAGGAGASYCRPCTDLARLEASLEAGLKPGARGAEGVDAEERARILERVKGWRQRCSTLLCRSRPGAGTEACSAPSTSLLTELAAIDQLSEGLSQRTAQCSAGGCQSTRCEPARAAANAFGALQMELHRLAEDPAALAGERRELATGFIFDEIETLSDAVLRAPALAAEGRYAAAEARLLFLRDAALASGASVPSSAEGLLADRLEEIAHTIDALAKAERAGVSGPMLGAIWRDYADASARLLLETASFKAAAPPRANAFASALNPTAAAASGAPGGEACDGAARLVQSTEQRLSEAMARLALCNVRAACHPEDDATAAIPPRAAPSGRSPTQQLSAQSSAAGEALRALFFQKDEDVPLSTDLQQYTAREAITVKPLAETNRCLADRSARVVLTPDGAEGAPPIEAHALDPSDSAVWLFEAPRVPGRYRVQLEGPPARGGGVFGASPPFEVAAAPPGCDGFNGTWQTDFGVLTIRVREGVARGTYRQNEEDRAGILAGEVDGATLTGTWHSELGAGGTRIALKEDGTSFSGTWSQSLDRVSGAGKWEGRCIAGGQPR